ncbi:MAG: asparagine synthetase [Candidatus Aenigmarchaeota archaeon]|nr:asparagine synthetase [Candidatus Aenigmarchaeota archaeon]
MRVVEYLKRDELKHVLKIQTTVLKTLQQFMISRGFVQLMPIVTSTLTDPLGPDPRSSVIKTPTIDYYGQRLVLTQSMILHKQLALISGLDRIFIFSPNIRLERKERIVTGKHLFEFTQMDFEIAHATMDDVMRLVEDMVVETIKAVKKYRKDELEQLERKLKVPEKPFRVYTTHEMEEEFGKDWELEASKAHTQPFWVVCHKREFYDREDPEKPGHYRNYDLVWPEGFGEALSGGEREWEYERIIRRIERDGLDKSKYEQYLELAKLGLLKPSAGAGIGIERFVRFLAGVEHVGDVQPFRRVPGEEVIV